MVLIDSNILIYAAQGTLKPHVLADANIAYASITKIETLGFPDITVHESQLLNALLSEWRCLDLDETTVDLTVSLRQTRKMTLGDAIIAATALAHDCELWTANTADFARTIGLRIHNPVV